MVSKKIYKITCPTNELKLNLVKNKIFYERKGILLPDAIIDITKFQSQIADKKINLPNMSKKNYLSNWKINKAKKLYLSYSRVYGIFKIKQ